MEEEHNSESENQIVESEGSDGGTTESESAEKVEPQSRFPDLDELQQQVAKRIKSNRKFLDTYLSEEVDIATNDLDSLDMDDSEDDDEESLDDDTFEEL